MRPVLCPLVKRPDEPCETRPERALRHRLARLLVRALCAGQIYWAAHDSAAWAQAAGGPGSGEQTVRAFATPLFDTVAPEQYLSTQPPRLSRRELKRRERALAH